MKRLLKYVLTKKEKMILVFLCLMILGVIWFIGIYIPVQDRIEAADTAELEEEIAIEQAKTLKIKTMQTEIKENKEAGLAEVPTYNNFKEEVEELNRIFGNATEFQFQFTEPELSGTTVRRNIAVSFRAKSYEEAENMVKEALASPYRDMIHDLSLTASSLVDAEHVDDIKADPVTVTFLMTVFETTYDAENTEGLPQSETSASSGGGLANSDMSDLERSDLETAAESILEN